MKSIWYAFIDDYKEQIPYKAISVILEAFFWYYQSANTEDEAYKNACHNNVNKLMT